MQGAQILRNEAYLSYVVMMKDEAQHRRWTFYEAVTVQTEKDKEDAHPLAGATLPLQSQSCHEAQRKTCVFAGCG